MVLKDEGRRGIGAVLGYGSAKQAIGPFLNLRKSFSIQLTSMARKCNIFFQTACTITPETLTEHLWKAQRIPQACTIHPELSL